MKKTGLLFTLFFSVIALSLLLFSCTGEGAGTGEPLAPPEYDIPEGAIFGKGVETAIISNYELGTSSEAYLREIYNELIDKTEQFPFVGTDTEKEMEHELVFGDTSRYITLEAKRKLSDKISSEAAGVLGEDYDENDVVGYAVYASGGSVAVVWNDFHAESLAFDFFCESFLPEDYLVLEDGYFFASFFSLSAYLKEREERIFAEKWAALEAAIPEEYREDIMFELRRMYALYDDKSVEWIASLYDPETGGFYNSISARDTVGFLPDIENTLYAFTLVGSLGMAEMFGNDWTRAIPKDLLVKAAEWIISLQAEDGYFYHPQWTNPSDLRLTRDIGSAKTVIRAAGLNPKYISYNLSEGNLTGRLSGSTAVSVSKAVAVADALWQFESVENYRQYLDGWESELIGISDSERAWKFYLWGSTLQSTATYIRGDMIKMTIDFFDKHQNPENGVWTEGLYLNSTNAIHKIGSVYNSLHAELKYADKMIDSTLRLLTEGLNTDTTCEIYNVWSCFQYIYRNVRNHSSGSAEERAARCEAMKTLVYKSVVPAMKATYQHLIHYRYSDGSFSYYRGMSLHAMQGCPSAVYGTKEGDIGGFLLATHEMPYFILASLELEEYIVPIFTEEDRMTYINGIRDAQPVVKK